MRDYSVIEILDKVKGLASFQSMPKYLLVGIRSKSDKFNEFDDMFYFIVDGNLVAKTTGTTNPGKDSLLGGSTKYNPLGAAIVKSDEIYYDVYEFGLHKGKMEALRQVGNMLYYRDGDNDEKSEEQGKVYPGNNYTNFHFNSYNLWDSIVRKFIGAWSFGCQVANMSAPYRQIIGEVKKNKVKVTYALLKEF